MKKENEKGIEKERKGKKVHNYKFFGNKMNFLLNIIINVYLYRKCKPNILNELTIFATYYRIAS